jgi:hypothetical protein
MASPLKVTHLDSPLRRSNAEGEREKPPASDSPPSAAAEAGSSSPGVVTRPPAAAPTSTRRSEPRRRGAAETPAATASPPKDSRSTRGASRTAALSASPWPPVEGFWEPPTLDERVELISTRLPVSLSRALERHTRALRDRHDLASQKALPMQEVLAALVWALGDPQDEAAVDRLDAVYRSYRARRMAAAARALEQR